MKLAVPYKDGNVFEHFGKAETFKIYDVDFETQKINSSEIVETLGKGHELATKLMKEKEVSILVTGNIGEDAINAFGEYDITIITGATGNADEFVQGLVDGTVDLYDDGDCGCGCDDEHCCCGEDEECSCSHHEEHHDCGCGK